MLDPALARVARLELGLAAVGGTLHDVNNILTVLAGQLYLLTEGVREDPQLFAKSRRARNAAERASSLIREALSAGRSPEDSSTVICPARHMATMAPLLRQIVDAKHKLHFRHSHHPWHISASPSQFESALTNLVINAHEALRGSGQIDVSVTNERLERPQADSLGLLSGAYVRLRVADTGIGVPKATLARITEPLFTTKTSDRGHGMGLAMVKRFTQQAGGTIDIKSAHGEGTTMDIWLPRAIEPTDATANMTLPLSTMPGGDETVLLMSSDSELRTTIEQLLAALGYTVVPARSPKQALEHARRRQRIDAVICERSADRCMVEERWLNELRERKKGIRQLAILGVAETGAAVAPDADGFVHRPISIGDLASALRAVFEQADSL